MWNQTQQVIDALGCWSNGEALLKKSITNAHFEFLTLPFCFRVCYDRCRYYPTIATFIISAMWHGVYPGYYMTFLTAIPITLAARAVSDNLDFFIIATFVRAACHILIFSLSCLYKVYFKSLNCFCEKHYFNGRKACNYISLFTGKMHIDILSNLVDMIKKLA